MAVRWDTKARRFRGADGAFVAAGRVRQAAGRISEQLEKDFLALGKKLERGMRIETWQTRMEHLIRSGHIATSAIARGGWKNQSRAAQRQVEARIARELRHLGNLALELENGLPLDGRFTNRLRMYARAVIGTYEQQRRADLNEHREVIRERRLLHAEESCDDCIGYARRGWQEPGVLPGIGEECACKSNCRCTFELRYKRKNRHE
jgi:hypothetical protein